MAGVRLEEPGGVHMTSNTPIMHAALGTYVPSLMSVAWAATAGPS